MATPNASQGAYKPRPGLFTQFSLPKPITANGSEIAFSRIDRAVQLLGKLFFTNIIGTRFNVVQEGDEGSLTAPEFSAVPCKLERLFSTGVVAFTVWAAQRLAGRKGMALAAVGQLGLGLLTTLYNNKGSSANANLREVLNMEIGASDVKRLKVGERPEFEHTCKKLLEEKVGEPLQTYLDSWAPDAWNPSATALQAGFSDLFERNMVHDLVKFLCSSERTEEKHSSARALFASFMSNKLKGQSVEVLQSYVKEIASARTAYQEGQVAILKQLLSNSSVVSDLKFVNVLKGLNTRGVAPEIKAVGFEVASQRLKGDIAEVMKIFSAEQLENLIPHLDAASLENIINIVNTDSTPWTGYTAPATQASRYLMDQVAVWESKEDCAALICRINEGALKLGEREVFYEVVQRLSHLINEMPAQTTEISDEEGTKQVLGRYEWLLQEASVEVLKALPVAAGREGDRIKDVDPSALFNELSQARKAHMLKGAIIPNAFERVSPELLENILKVLTSDAHKSTPMATALLSSLAGLNQEDLSLSLRLWLFAAVTKAKVGGEPALQQALVQGLQTEMFQDSQLVQALMQVHQELTSERVKTALVTTFLGNEIDRYPTVAMKNAAVMVFALESMYPVVKNS